MSVPLCDGCKHPAPRRRALTDGAGKLVGYYGRVCYRRAVLALQEAGMLPVGPSGRIAG